MLLNTYKHHHIEALFGFAFNAKRFAIVIFFLFLIPSAVFGRTDKSKFLPLFLQICVTKIGSPSLGFYLLSQYRFIGQDYYYIPTTAVPMANKLGRMVTYLEVGAPIVVT